MGGSKFFKFALSWAALTFAVAGKLPAQVPVVIDLGIRGGVLANDSFQANPYCCKTIFGTSSFTSDKLRTTFGPTIGVLLYDRVEVRFEAVRRRFGYQIQTDLVVPSYSQHGVASTHGHFWEYPLLGTYRFSYGPVRPFAGGGIGLGGTTKFSTDYQYTSTTQLPAGPMTTITSSRATYSSPASTAYYIIGGVDGRTSYVSIRPELRYSRFRNDPNSSANQVKKPNQFEFLIGISVHPFRVK